MNKQISSGGTVGKALGILDLVADAGRPVRFSELLSASQHPKATLYRFLQTLTNQGMLAFDPEHQTYSLGMRLVRLAHEAWRQASLAPIARPIVDDLAVRLGETVHLAQMVDGQVLYVDKRNANEPIEMFSQAGRVGPGYCTGVGKAMMAYLDEPAQARAIGQQAFYPYTDHTLTTPEALKAEFARIRDEGVAYDREEHEPGIICVAAPILSREGGRVLGGLSVTTSTDRHKLDELDVFRPALLKAARDIGSAAANWQFPR